VPIVDRLFGALIISLVLLTSALLSVILSSEEGFIFSVVCIGLAALIGIILLTTGKEEIPGKLLSDEDIEKELDDKP
jgi:hypothetical protein